MKTMKFLYILAVPMFIFSCTKEGKQGPEGPPGAANVTAVTFTTPAWTGSQINLTVPQITTDIYNSGTVLAYMEFSSVTGVFYHVPGFVVNAAYQVRVYDQLGSMRFNLLNPDGTGATGTLPAVSKIKVLIIPAGTTVAGRGISPGQVVLDELAAAGVDVDDYEAVKQYYHLSD